MRILLALVLLLTVLVVGGLLAAPRVVDWEDYREVLTDRAEALTGARVSIDGAIDLRFLPTPTLVLAETTLTPGGSALDRTELAVDRLDIQLKLLPLLRGRPEVAQVRLVRPVLQLDRANRNDAGDLAVLGTLPFEQLSVIDGRVILRRVDAPVVREFEQINLDAMHPGMGRPLEVTGRFGLEARPFSFALRLGRLGEATSTTLQLQLSAEDGSDDPPRLGISGVLALAADAPRLTGELTLSGGGAQAALAAGGALLGRSPPPLPAWFDRSFALAGRLELARDRLRLDQGQLEFAGTEARGSLDLTMAPVPDLQLDLQLSEVTLSDPAALGPQGLGALLSLPRLPHGRFDLSIGRLTHAGGAARRVRLTLALAGAAGVRIEQARAVLPGQTDVSLTGSLQTAGAQPALHGELSAVTHDLRRLLGWLGLEVEGVADGRLQTLSLSGRVTGDAESLRLIEMDLRVDASHITGSLALGLTPDRQLAAVLAIDRLNLDAYRAGQGPRALLALLRQQLGTLDVAVQAEIGRLIWHDLRLDEVALDARAIDGQLAIHRLAIGNLAAARTELSGTADLRAGTFELAAELTAPKPARLLRQLGLEPPLMLARLTPVTVSGIAQGDGTRLELDLTFQHEQAQLSLSGPVTWPEGAPSYALDVQASHPDYAALIEQLGGRPPTLDPEAPRALTVTGKLRGNREIEHAVVGSLRFGAMSLTGGVTWQQQGARPVVNARLSLGEVHEGTLTSVLGLLGLPIDPGPIDPGPIDPGMPASGVLGAWPADPLPLGWLGRFDGALELFAKGGLAGQGVEVAVRLDDGRLMLDRLAARLGASRLELQASFDTRRQLPFLALAVDLEGGDARRITQWLGLPAVLEGTADLYAEATSAGYSARDLVRGLIGHVELEIRDGRLLGPGLGPVATPVASQREDLPTDRGTLGIRSAHADQLTLSFETLRGRFALSRGIASAEAVGIDLPQGRGALSGTVDLLVWAADLVLRIDPETPPNGAPFRLHIVGALDRPQTRVLEAPSALDGSVPEPAP